MRDLNRSSTCIPKCEDRRRPPYLRRSRSAAPIRRSSDGRAERSEAKCYSFHERSELIESEFGKGRPISTRRGEAAPYLPNERRGQLLNYFLVRSNGVRSQ